MHTRAYVPFRSLRGMLLLVSFAAFILAAHHSPAQPPAASPPAPAAAPAQEAGRSISFQTVPAEEYATLGFDPAQSAGLFVGIRVFLDEKGQPSPDILEIPYAVDDAVDLAHLFAMELKLITPRQTVLALSGEPQKPESLQRLNALVKAGAERTNAAYTNLLRRIPKICQQTQGKGLLVFSFATHGYDQDGHRLMAEDSSASDLNSASIAVNKLLEDVARANAPRRLVLLDACREFINPKRTTSPEPGTAMSKTFNDAIANATGQAILTAATMGGYSYDDKETSNGVFTSAVLAGLRGKAPPDERGFITAETLANFLDQHVRDWVKKNRPQHQQQSRGVGFNLDDHRSGRLPLAVSPKAFKEYKEWVQRREPAKNAIKICIDWKTITPSLAEEICATLDSIQDPAKGAPLADRIERLAKKESSYGPADFVGWWQVEGHKIHAAAPSAPSPPSASIPSMPSTLPEALAAEPPAQAAAPPSAPEMPSIPAEAVEAAAAAPASDIALVAPRSGVPGIELTEKPAKSLSRLEAQSGVTFAWRATGEAYGARYRYRLNDQSPVENYPRASVTLSNLEAGRRHTFQVQAQTRQGASEPAVYAFEVRANEPPAVSFAEAPAQGAQVAARSVRVRLTGSDPDGKVTRYTLAVNDPDDPQRVFENATGEFELTDKVLEDVLHRLIAQTMDDSGALSPPVTRDFTFRYATPTPPPTQAPTPRPTQTPPPASAQKSTDGRFLVSSENVILDTKTKLEWIVGPDQDTNYDNAVKWVESCRVAGGGWRMPTRKELLELYQKGKGDRNIDPVFKQTGWFVWAEPRDSSSAWYVYFGYGDEAWNDRSPSYDDRAFGVRSRR